MCELTVILKHRDIYEVYEKSLCSEVEKKRNVLQFVLNNFNVIPTENIIQKIKKRLYRGYFNHLRSKMNQLRKMKKSIKLFEIKYKDWLEKDFYITITVEDPLSHEFIDRRHSHEACDLNELNNEQTLPRDIIEYKPPVSFTETIEPIFMDLDDRKYSDELRNRYNFEKPAMMTPEKALALFIDIRLTKSTYLKMRKAAKEHNSDLYPPYHKISQAKAATYSDNIIVSEIFCEVPLQDLLNHTVRRLLEHLMFPSPKSVPLPLTMIAKYGFDGTNSNSFKQKWNDQIGNDDHLFCSFLVPLQIINDENKEVVWNNPSPSSTRFCRPIHVQFIKESYNVIKAEERNIKRQIAYFQRAKIDKFNITFDLSLTMIDGKICSALTDLSNQCYYICGGKLSEMNNIDSLKKRSITESFLVFGIPLLHAYIRFLECVLHISYRLDVKKWRITKDLKGIVESRKKKIQNDLHKELGIKVHFPRQGFGSSNDGNTARRFFRDFNRVAEITGFDHSLLERFHTILGVLSAGKSIDTSLFRIFCYDTANQFIHLYHWYYMPPSMHVILFHGYIIIDKAILPISMYSEEAQECRNKDVKRYRELYSRKKSRVDTNIDMFRRLLLSSDPLISLEGRVEKNKKTKLTVQMKNLLHKSFQSSDEENSFDDEM